MAEALRLAVRAWSAWAPERETPAAWRAWAGATEMAVDETDGASIAMPMMLRRRCTALGQKNLRIARVSALLHRMAHIPGRNELSFLDVHRPSA